MRYFSTMARARGALALDTGFDPFLSGGWGRCTKAKLADAGYAVDAAEARRSDVEKAKLPRAVLFCWASDCGGREGDGDAWDYDLSLSIPPDDYRGWECPVIARFAAHSRAQAIKIATQRYGSQFSAIS